MQKSILIFILILLAGLIPISIYFLENKNSLDVNIASLPSRNLSLLEQQAQAFAGLVVKPVYMMLSLIIILASSGNNMQISPRFNGDRSPFLSEKPFARSTFTSTNTNQSFQNTCTVMAWYLRSVSHHLPCSKGGICDSEAVSDPGLQMRRERSSDLSSPSSRS